MHRPRHRLFVRTLSAFLVCRRQPHPALRQLCCSSSYTSVSHLRSSFASYLIFSSLKVGQINTSSVPRGIAMVCYVSRLSASNILELALVCPGKDECVAIWVSFVSKVELSAFPHLTFRQSLAQGSGDPINGLYATNASLPLRAGAGIRQVYKFGLYSYCGYLNKTAGTCTNTTMANKYLPFNALIADMSLNYSALTIFIINGTSSFESQAIGSHTHAASSLILIGTICAFLAFVMCVNILSQHLLGSIADNYSLSGVFKHTLAFLASACLAILATVFILTAASLWTSAIHTSESVNNLILNTTSIPLGIKVSGDSGLSLLWAAVGCLFASLVPYLIRSDFTSALHSQRRLTRPCFFLQLLHLPGLGSHTKSYLT